MLDGKLLELLVLHHAYYWYRSYESYKQQFSSRIKCLQNRWLAIVSILPHFPKEPSWNISMLLLIIIVELTISQYKKKIKLKWIPNSEKKSINFLLTLPQRSTAKGSTIFLFQILPFFYLPCSICVWMLGI